MNKLTALIEAAKAAIPWREASRKEFEKQNPVPAYYRFHNDQYIQCYPISEEQWWESVKYHNDFLLWNQAWEACVNKSLANPATILELCALLEKAEEALKCVKVYIPPSFANTHNECHEALAAIKQWKEQSCAGMK